ncbi:MAG: DUF721 domain-containing protein [Alphaproteobacteria bacterium]
MGGVTKRPRRLFPRALGEVVKTATAPVMKQQGKFYSALRRDWAQIVGEERAGFLRPLKVQFTGPEQKDAVLHLEVSAAKAPEIAYMEAALLEQMARYFGYRAVTKLVLHPSHGFGAAEAPAPEKSAAPAVPPPELPQAMPGDLRSILTRMAQHIKQG